MSNIFGLDLGSDTIKLLHLDKKGAKKKVIMALAVKNPTSGFVSVNEKEMAPLIETLKQIKKEANLSTNLVSVSLPERHIFIQTLELPKMSEKELQQAISLEAEALIPKPIKEVGFDWRLIEDEKTQREGKVKVLIIAAPLTLTTAYTRVLKLAGFEPLSLESESLALVRSTQAVVGRKNLLIFNWGMKSADIIVVKNGDFYLNRSLASTGEALTRAISVGLGLDETSAEEYKKTYGLSTDLEGKVGKTLQPLLAALSNEIKKAINFFEEKEDQKIDLMVLTGGSSLLYGGAEYFTKTLGLEVQRANAFQGLEIASSQAEVLAKNAPIYSVVVGLAQKEI